MVDFEMSCNRESEDFNLAMELLHSFEYDEAEKVFARVLYKNPTCAMAYWGVAMSNFHPLWSPPSRTELEKGYKALTLAKTLPASKREVGYLDAITAFYEGWDSVDHYTRCLRFEQAMEKLHNTYPNDKEATIFYALSLTASADP